MPPLVSRGLIGTSNRFGSGMKPSDPDDATARAIERLTKDPPRGMLWKERMEWAQSLSQGKPDFWGRRLFSEAGIADARRVARAARAAYRNGTLPKNAIVWGQLRESIRRIYRELSGVPA